MEVEEYIDNYKEKIKREETERELLFKRLNKQARQAADMLGEKYQIEKIYLFGSLVNKDKFRLNSDVDLAVKGLSSEYYLDAWGDVEEKLGHDFDLVRLEKANEMLIETIEEEGEVIYESGGSESK